MKRKTRASGFTLIELMMSSVLMVLTIAAALTVAITYGQLMNRQARTGESSMQAQAAMHTLEYALRQAGSGIDPWMAFDFDYYKCALPGAAAAMTDSANCATAKRDANDGPDDLVIAYRDPAYAVTAPSDVRTSCAAAGNGTYLGHVWGVSAASGNSITLELKPGDTIYRGQVLLVACADGLTYTYVTVSNAKQSVASTATACSATALSVYTNAAAADPFNQPAALATACFSTGGANAARAFAVKRQHYFLRKGTNGVVVTPYLVLDEGLDLNDDGALNDQDVSVVASDIEDLQLTYATAQPGIMALATAPTGWVQATFALDSDADGIWGEAAAAEQLTADAATGGTTAQQTFAAATTAIGGTQYSCTGQAAITRYQYPCIYGTTPVEDAAGSVVHAYRWTAWTGNISVVSLALSARSAMRDEQLNAPVNAVVPALFNRPATATGWYASTRPAQRRRMTMVTSVRPADMSVSRPSWR